MFVLLVMRVLVDKISLVLGMFILASISSLNVFASCPIPMDRFDSVQGDFLPYLESHSEIDSLDALIACLPVSYLSNFSLVHTSGSPEKADVSHTFPRAILYGLKGSPILAFTTRPGSDNFLKLQVIEANPARGRHDFYNINFSTSTRGANQSVYGIEKNPRKCAVCHSEDQVDVSRMKPIWGVYPSWAGFYGDVDDLMVDPETRSLDVFNDRAYNRMSRSFKRQVLPKISSHVPPELNGVPSDAFRADVLSYLRSETAAYLEFRRDSFFGQHRARLLRFDRRAFPIDESHPRYSPYTDLLEPHNFMRRPNATGSELLLMRNGELLAQRILQKPEFQNPAALALLVYKLLGCSGEENPSYSEELDVLSTVGITPADLSFARSGELTDHLAYQGVFNEESPASFLIHFLLLKFEDPSFVSSITLSVAMGLETGGGRSEVRYRFGKAYAFTLLRLGKKVESIFDLHLVPQNLPSASSMTQAVFAEDGLLVRTNRYDTLRLSSRIAYCSYLDVQLGWAFQSPKSEL